MVALESAAPGAAGAGAGALSGIDAGVGGETSAGSSTSEAERILDRLRQGLQVEVALPASVLSSVGVGGRAYCIVHAVPGERFAARIVSVSPNYEASESSLRVRLALDRKDPRVQANMAVLAQFLVNPSPGETSASVIIPLSAITRENGESRVRVVKPQGVEERRVEVGNGLGRIDPRYRGLGGRGADSPR